jgi:hypothetical protein
MMIWITTMRTMMVRVNTSSLGRRRVHYAVLASGLGNKSCVCVCVLPTYTLLNFAFD